MDSKYKVSVIVPVYNVSDYIEESVASVCEQDFSEFQLILVNDGTKDDSIVKAEKIIKEHNFSEYKIINQPNGGLPCARNTGIREAEGEFVTFIDSDDIIDKKFISRLYGYCIKENTVAAFTDYEVTGMNNRKGNDNADSGYEILDRDQLIFNNMTRRIKIHLCAMLLKREFLLENDLWFNESLRFGEEVDYTWRMYPLIDKIVYSKSHMYKYLVRENSLMTNQNIDRVVYLFENMNKVINKWFSENSSDAVKYRWAENKIFFEKVHAFAKQSDIKTLKELLGRTDYKARAKSLWSFPDTKIKILSFILYLSPRLFWSIFKILEK